MAPIEPSMNEKSCVGCKYLYTRGRGYSNYTWMETTVECALNKNPDLPSEEPYDWEEKDDAWPPTSTRKCELYAAGPKVCLDVDGENGPADKTDDEEAIAAICEHSGRGRKGDIPRWN